MVFNGFKVIERVETKCTMSLEITVLGKSLATTFFAAVVQGNYNVPLRRDWLHANMCVPSTIHQDLTSEKMTFTTYVELW